MQSAKLQTGYTTRKNTTTQSNILNTIHSTMSTTTTLSPNFQQLMLEMINACAMNDPNAFLNSYQALQQQFQSCPQQSSQTSEKQCPSSESKITFVQDSEDKKSTKKVSKRYTKLRKQLKSCENFKDNYFVFSTTTQTTKDSGKKKRNAAKKRSKENDSSSTSGSDHEESSRVTSDSKKRKVTEISNQNNSSDTSSAVLDSSTEQQYQQLMNSWITLQQFMQSSTTETTCETNPSCEIIEEQAVPNFFSSHDISESSEFDSIFNNPTDFEFSSSSLIDLPETSDFSELFSEFL
ncbi:hypothetical protein C9374_008879 [Naegleria lovaniensis]|uniref:Uncharacterized protein n=1 Tax=Naegleria lovaniensis TaxID=51637 RepID=A0AA88GHW5_NAELO|nr:uncharacterized protein C9374_008879 [Naegleria lovaniensis]KAG2377794.1 hypothetical protein C9374_008879 [Naegleria lovaniensis]